VSGELARRRVGFYSACKVRAPLLKPQSTFEDAAAGRRSFSLSLSVTGRIPVLLGAALVGVVFGVTRGWIVAIGGLGLAVVLGAITTTRRIDVDGDGLTFVPLLPFMPTQRVSFNALGPFAIRRARYTGVYAPLDASATYRLGGVFQRGEVVIGSSFKADFTDEPPTPSELQELLERIRRTPAHEVHVDPTLIVSEGKLRRNENLVIAAGTVAAIFLIGITLALIHG
jgi:hypothetical protein